MTTTTRPDAPALRLAVGSVRNGEISTIYQQLHSYPVGNSGKELAARTHGAKYWIAPARREILVGFDAIVGVDSPDPTIERDIVEGLHGRLATPRYGLPFAGDNNLLIDRIDVLDAPPPTRWYEVMTDDSPPRRGSCRLTVTIDRSNSANTDTRLFAPTEPRVDPPDAAWTWVPRAPT